MSITSALKQILHAAVAHPLAGFIRKEDNATKLDVVVSESTDLAIASIVPVSVKSADSPAVDAFGRWRVSTPETIFDSKNIFDDPDLAANVDNQPLFFDNQETAGGGTGTAYSAAQSSQSLSVSANTAGTRVRQTKMRFNYQPAKSQMCVFTFNFNGLSNGNTKRIGLFDANNGLFLEAIGSGVRVVLRSGTSGSPVDLAVAQASWNLDTMNGSGPSGISLDWSKTQILLIDYQWLGVGRVRFGFDIGGVIIYCHEFLNANALSMVYMSTPNLPIRCSISNDGSGAAATITQICVSVMSEGGVEDLGSLRYNSTGGTLINANVLGTAYVVCGLRLKSAYLGAAVKIKSITMVNATPDDYEWLLLLNPTLAAAVTFTDQARSAVQFAVGNAGNPSTSSVTALGTIMDGGIVKSGASIGSVAQDLDSAILLGSLINGTRDEIYLCARPFAANADINGGLGWRELL